MIQKIDTVLLDKLPQDRTIVVLGAGESGTGAAYLAKQKCFNVFVSDMGQIAPKYLQKLKQWKIPFEQGQHNSKFILDNADLVIKSPGIPPTATLVQQLLEKGIPVIDELEFASYYTKATLIGITGSNGKTTTTRLLHHILQKAGYKAGLAGNVGYSLAEQVAKDDQDYYVIEMSSFQLDGIYSFRPNIAILLNITPDHLDRYEYKLENYIASKFQLVQQQTSEDLFIYNGEDQHIDLGFKKFFKAAQQHMNPVRLSQLEEHPLFLRVATADYSIAKDSLSLRGKHNWFNTACAIIAAKHLGVKDSVLNEALVDFENEAHRLEKVVEINGVTYINDSKATNVDATYYALDAMDSPVVWIVGGVDKGNDYSRLYDLVRQKVRAIICLGRDNSKILKGFEGIHEYILETSSIPEAIKVASLYAESGDKVLLSPACASFDLFKNYKDRGEQFKQLLLQQAQILKKGVTVQTDLNINLNPSAQEETDRLKP
ncbi:MAG: UDP-N-acetylmuramoyl-L-alanine--D-glutamate ligase [Saprospiraceae bacterium]|nr:UDP-N-acetylmuramoyl-L-alanine--D-glutamate ligase [Saprospiraceae bacterium]